MCGTARSGVRGYKQFIKTTCRTEKILSPIQWKDFFHPLKGISIHPLDVQKVTLYLFKFYTICITYCSIILNYFALTITLQQITATIVLKNVATIAGAITAAGFALPYWLRYAMIFTGINCKEEIFITRNVHISLLAVREL